MSVATITLFAAIAFTVVGVGTFFHYFLLIFWWPRAAGTITGNVADPLIFCQKLRSPWRIIIWRAFCAPSAPIGQIELIA